MPTKKIPPPSAVDMESLEDPVAFRDGGVYTARLQRLHFGELFN